MTTDTIPLPARDDTLLGICQAIGDDLSFNPDWLRVSLAASLLWDARVMIAGYLAAGLMVAMVGWLVPSRRAPAAVGQAPEPLPLAA